MTSYRLKLQQVNQLKLKTQTYLPARFEDGVGIQFTKLNGIYTARLYYKNFQPVTNVDDPAEPYTYLELWNESDDTFSRISISNLKSDIVASLDPDLNAIGALVGTGVLSRSADGIWALRTFQAPPAGLTITNPGGVAGNETFAFANDLAALEALSSTGLARRTGTDTWTVGAAVSVPEGGTGITSPTAGTIPYYNTPTTMATTGTFVQNAVVIGGASPAPLSYTNVGVNGQLLLGSTGASPGFNSMSGDATIANTGALTISANVVTDAKFRQSVGLSVIGRSANTTGNTADITGTAGQVLRVAGTALGFGAIDLSLAAAVTNTLAATNGGTGQSSYAVGDLLYASTTSVLSKLADVATGNALISGGVGVAPAWGKIGLTTHISGTLAVGNGGTGLTGGTSGGLLYFNSASTIASSAALTANAPMYGGGAGNPPVTGSNGVNGQFYAGVTSGPPAFVTMSGDATMTNTGAVTIANNAVSNAKMATAADGTIKSNISGGVAAPSDNTISAVFDKQFGTTQGSVVYRNSTGWVSLTPGTAGQFLTTQGAGANPNWSSGGAGTGTVTNVATSGLATGGPITSTGTVTVTAATQTTQEAASSNTVAVTPGTQQYHPSSPKAWVRFNSGGGIIASYNVTSVARNSIGNFTINFTTPFSSGNYTGQISLGSVASTASEATLAYLSTLTASNCNLISVNLSYSAYLDNNNYHVAFWGDQ